MTHEIRSHSTLGATVEMEAPAHGKRTLRGTAVVYNSLSRDLGGFRERFLPGSLTRTLKAGLLTAVKDHDDSMPLGSEEAGTLRVKDTAKGLSVEIDLPDTTYARDLITMYERGDYRGMSFKFGVASGGNRWVKENGDLIHEVREAELDHVSPVIRPAYADTRMSIRSLDSAATIDMAERYGIDLDRLAKVFVAIKRGIVLGNDERETLRQALRLLNQRPNLDGADDRAAAVLL